MQIDEWLLTPERVAIHLPTRTAVIADLHLGVSLVRRRGGDAIPAPAPDRSVAVLRGLMERHSVACLVVAGDLIEDGRANDAVGAWLAEMSGIGLELAAVVPGNHDRHLLPGDLPIFADGYRLGRWLVLHGDQPLPSGPVVHGHFHPCFHWDAVRSAPCFLLGRNRLVLPAFSEDAVAGMNVLGRRRWLRCRCCVIVGDTVLDFGTVGELTRKQRQ
jgi:putative SbcD/Mre11-related phosphoesterase